LNFSSAVNPIPDKHNTKSLAKGGTTDRQFTPDPWSLNQSTMYEREVCMKTTQKMS